MNINAIFEGIVLVFILAGSLLSLLSSLGFIRLSDVYLRAHGATLMMTLGITCILFGGFFYFWLINGVLSVRFLLVIVFVFITAPVAGHLITRSAYRSGVKLAGISIKDELKDDLAKLEQEREL